jgi:5'-3' exonuclease
LCDTKIVIITNDNDYLQLADTNIIIMNMQFKDITLRGTQNARCDLHCKAIYGDKSDNIQKIASFITKDSAKNLSQLSDIELKKWLHENGLVEKFAFNMNLISFENIPSDYVKRFYDHVQIGLIH